jgi:hypothetical protein
MAVDQQKKKNLFDSVQSNWIRKSRNCERKKTNINIRERWWWRHHLFFYFTHFTINGRDRQLSLNNSRFLLKFFGDFFFLKLCALLFKSGSNEIITGVIWSNKNLKKMNFFQNQILRKIIRLETKIENWSFFLSWAQQVRAGFFSLRELKFFFSFHFFTLPSGIYSSFIRHNVYSRVKKYTDETTDGPPNERPHKKKIYLFSLY